MTNALHWTVPPEHPALAGHFPGNPILPGAVLLDEALHRVAEQAGIAPDACELRSVKFLSPAKPGDELVIRHSTSVRGAIYFEVLAGTRKVASGSIVPSSPT